MSKKEKPKTTGRGTSVPLMMPPELEAKIEDARKKLPMLSKQDVMRLSLERGLSILVTQLTGDPATVETLGAL